MIHAIIDIGSNTVRMAVYQIKDSAVEQIMKKKDTTVGLASFMHDNVLEERGIKRLVYALEDFQKFLAALHIENISIFTTGALRNAANSREAIEEIKTRTGLDIYVIRGEEEAELDFIGATHDLAAEEGLLFDIGGASTEMVHYKAQKIVRKTSLPVGSLYLHTNSRKNSYRLARKSRRCARTPHASSIPPQISQDSRGFPPAASAALSRVQQRSLPLSFLPRTAGRSHARQSMRCSRASCAIAISQKMTPCISCAPFPTACTRSCPASSSPAFSPNASHFLSSPTATRACAKATSTTAF